MITTLLRRMRKSSDTIARWIALTTMVSMFTALALNGLFSMVAGVWAQPPVLESGVLEKAATIARIVDGVPPQLRNIAAEEATENGFIVRWLERYEDARLPVTNELGFDEGRALVRTLLRRPNAQVEAYEPTDWTVHDPDRKYALIIKLSDGTWLLYSVPMRRWGLDNWQRGTIIIVFVLFSTLLVTYIATRRLAVPLERFALGARRFGTDFQAPPLQVEGPREIRQAILAFNAMQAQLQGFVRERTQMLAAISHDLRAPLTRMRLRGEFIEDADQQNKLFRDVDEMQAMVNSALDFFRDEARFEATTTFDLAQLVYTIVDDFRDAGVEVSVYAPARLAFVGRPIGIKRALVNLLDNANKYGCNPGITVIQSGSSIEVEVTDCGPGIATDHLALVFTPFYRVESSRNKNTGGVGLGLSAAQTTMLEHGGKLELENRQCGGLIVRIQLPVR